MRTIDTGCAHAAHDNIDSEANLRIVYDYERDEDWRLMSY